MGGRVEGGPRGVPVPPPQANPAGTTGTTTGTTSGTGSTASTGSTGTTGASRGTLPAAPEMDRFTGEHRDPSPAYASTRRLELPSLESVGSAPVRDEPLILKILRGILDVLLELISLSFISTPTFNNDEALKEYGQQLGQSMGPQIRAAELWHRRLNLQGDFNAVLRDEVVRGLRAQHPTMSTPDLEAAADQIVAGMRQNLEGRTATDLVNSYAQSLGGAWPARAERVEGPAEARAMMYLMSAQQSGALANLPDSVIDGLLFSVHSGRADDSSMAHALTAIQALPEAERTQLFAALAQAPTTPAAAREIAWAIVTREHYGLSSANAAERAGATQRIRQAMTELPQLVAAGGDALDVAATRGVIGLDPPQSVTLGRDEAGQPITVDVRFHPGIPVADRERQLGLLRDASAGYPPAALRRLVAGDEAHPISVQFLPAYAVRFGEAGAVSPDREDMLGVFKLLDNTLRINADALADPERARHTIAHEMAHAFSDSFGRDVGNTPLSLVGRIDTYDSGSGTPLQAHWEAINQRFEMAMSRCDCNRLEGKAFGEAETRVAQGVGAPTGYAANGGYNEAFPRLRVEEFLAEAISHWVIPSERARLQRVDPLMAHAVETAMAELSAGRPEAAQLILNFAPSPATGAAAARDIVSRTDVLSAGNLNELAPVIASFGMAADAYAAYRPPSAGLRTLHERERGAALEQGQRLLGDLDRRIAQLQGSGRSAPDAQGLARLQAMRTHLAGALERLGTEIGAVAAPDRPPVQNPMRRTRS